RSRLAGAADGAEGGFQTELLRRHGNNTHQPPLAPFEASGHYRPGRLLLQGKRSNSGQARSLFIPPRNKFRTTSIAKAAAAGKMVGYELPHFLLPAKGGIPQLLAEPRFSSSQLIFSLVATSKNRFRQGVGGTSLLAGPWRNLQQRRILPKERDDNAPIALCR